MSKPTFEKIQPFHRLARLSLEETDEDYKKRKNKMKRERRAQRKGRGK